MLVNKQGKLKKLFLNWLPPLAGIGLIGLFLALANWQLQRAAEKETLAAMFDADARVTPLNRIESPVLFQAVSVRGRYLAERQFLIDNIIKDNRLGHYVITPFEQVDDNRVLLVNRGWIEKARHSTSLPAIAVTSGTREIVARIGRLPRVALRPEQAISSGQGWPKVAVYPQIADIEAELKLPVAETVLLLDPQAADGYIRLWQPPARDSMMHYGYAFQWGALAVTVLVILVWQFRKKRRLAARKTA